MYCLMKIMEILLNKRTYLSDYRSIFNVNHQYYLWIIATSPIDNNADQYLVENLMRSEAI